MAVTACGVEKPTLYRHFTPDELGELEKEGLDLRRTKYSPSLSDADKSLIKEAKGGSVPAIKLMYQKFEHWSEKTRHEVTGKDGKEIAYKDIKDRDDLDELGDNLIEAIKNGSGGNKAKGS